MRPEPFRLKVDVTGIGLAGGDESTDVVRVGADSIQTSAQVKATAYEVFMNRAKGKPYLFGKNIENGVGLEKM